jgi:membrane protein
MAAETSARTPAGRWSFAALRHTSWRVVVATVGTCMRNRVTGLAAEAAFFAILSLPPLIFALAGSIGYVFAQLDTTQIAEVRHTVLDLASRALTPDTVDKIIRPTLNDVLRGGRYDVISIGFVLALWSGSRALNVFVDTITIMYGLGGHRGIVKTRMLSFSLYVMGLGIIRTRALSFLLYVLGMLTGVVTIPLVVAGPRVVARTLPQRLDFLNHLYWPTVVLLCVCFLTTLYHLSVPVRTAWRYNVPGAVFSMFCWIVGSAVLRCRHRAGVDLDLWSARRTDRRAAVALHPLHCGTHRCRTERGIRPAVAAEGADLRPLRAAAQAQPRRGAAVAGSA